MKKKKRFFWMFLFGHGKFGREKCANGFGKVKKKIDYIFQKGRSTTARDRLNGNISAIKTLKRIESEKRFATEEEQEVLSCYAGWGGLPDVFRPKHKSYQELKDLLTETEYDAARGTVTDAFYTNPEIARCIFDCVKKFGFNKGNVLEPALGTGNFFGVMEPDPNIIRYGVEIDSITGRIAKQLYQTAHISICGIEESQYDDNFFDVVVGNIPFGDYKIMDRKYDKYNFKVHDYFIAKSIDLVRPGGIVALITSKGTMDKKNSSFREYVSKRANLLGAVRLPGEAFSSYAGTNVSTDILFFQKKEKQNTETPDWIQLAENQDGVMVNNYYVKHPDMILGTMVYDNRFGDGKYSSCVNDNFSINDLKKALSKITGRITDNMILNSPENEECIPSTPDAKNFTYYITDDKKVYYKKNSVMYLLNLTQKEKRRYLAFDSLKKCLRELIEKMKDSSDEAVKKQQEMLNSQYEQFVAEYNMREVMWQLECYRQRNKSRSEGEQVFRSGQKNQWK